MSPISSRSVSVVRRGTDLIARARPICVPRLLSLLMTACCTASGSVFVSACGADDAASSASTAADGGDVGSAVADGAVVDGGALTDGASDPDANDAASHCTAAPNTPGGSDGAGGCFPDEASTGVPSGLVLTKYTGPCTLKSDNAGATVVLDGVDATSCGILAVYDVAVEIKNSVVPVIDRTNDNGSVDIRDSEARGPGWVGGVLWGSNITATRVEVTGGQHSVHCEGHCTVVDSWLHAQEAPTGSATHNNAFISNGGSAIVVRHNSLFCSPADNGAGGGCTADASIFGDFDALSDITFEQNLFVATPSGGYCGTFGYNPGKTYGSNPANIHVTGNVFQRGTNQKCGVFGPVTSFLDANGNTWSANRYDDGTAITP